MSAKGIDGDFTVADTAMLNRFLRDYFRQHGQGGTHSQQRNMRHLFSYLSRELGHPHPYTDALHRYSEQKQRRPASFVRRLHPGPARGDRQRPGPRLRGRTKPPHGRIPALARRLWFSITRSAEP